MALTALLDFRCRTSDLLVQAHFIYEDRFIMNNRAVGSWLVLASFALSTSGTAIAGGTDLLSFEGGGFRAMTADAGIIGAALKGKQMSAGDLLANVGVISGNSGGTWFSTCLAYSPEFVSGLEKVDGFFDATTGGYMGILSASYKAYVKKLAVTDNPVVNSFIKQVGSQNAGAELSQYLKLLKYAGSLNWLDALRETVFKPYDTANLIQHTNFKDSQSFRTSALPKQPLVFEISWSTNGAGIGRFSLLNPESVFPTPHVRHKSLT